jgi:hypothetical protein
VPAERETTLLPVRCLLKVDASTTPKENFMEDHHEAKDLSGYDPGSPEVAKSPISVEELNQLKASTLFTDTDVVYLRLSYDVLKDQAEDLVKMWRGIIALHPHLSAYIVRASPVPRAWRPLRVSQCWDEWLGRLSGSPALARAQHGSSRTGNARRRQAATCAHGAQEKGLRGCFW